MLCVRPPLQVTKGLTFAHDSFKVQNTFQTLYLMEFIISAVRSSCEPPKFNGVDSK